MKLLGTRDRWRANRILALPLMALLASGGTLLAQTARDDLEEITVVGVPTGTEDPGRLPPIQGTSIWSGKKSEVIGPQELDANLAERIPRQIFAKVPGVFVYDMDGSGNQINIATRGLDPHRGWEFNIRRNGVITNTDMYGYPASHFSIPMEGIERIEIVRGTGSLQYGAQFGGQLNYVTKRAEQDRRVSFETINTAGSNGLLSTYNAIGGRAGNTEYYVDFSRRISDGYRVNGETEFETQSLTVDHAFTDTLSLTAEIGHSVYAYRLPGPLTDQMFSADPRQATRSRDYYSPDITIPAVTIGWQPGERTAVSWTVSGVLGDRSSVMFVAPADVPDAIDPVTQMYAPRTVDIDDYRSLTTELKALHRYTWSGREHALAAGLQVFDNDLDRRQLGVGTTGSDFDLSLTVPGWGRDLRLKSDNVALFAENSFTLTPRLSLNPGFRIESGRSRMSGDISYLDPGAVPTTIEHEFTLWGISVDFVVNEQSEVYGGWSQAYRPVIFKDIVPSSALERVDDNLEDAKGHTFELGYRGDHEGLQWDVGVFLLDYGNRMGTLAQIDEQGQFYNLRTNVGDSLTFGAELFLEYEWQIYRGMAAEVFTSTAWLDAEYRDAFVRVGTDNEPIDGNTVQSVPELISRNGLRLHMPRASLTLLYSYTAESFADALNTVTPSSNGAVGLVPSYGLLDLSASIPISETVRFRLSANNLTDEQYFTKRPEFYPGPGIWPSDGRTYNVSLEFSFAR